jgi:hypothetical protein
VNLKRLVALVTSLALTSASYPSAQVDQPVVPAQAIQATGLSISGTLRSDHKAPIANACLRLRRLDPDTIVGRSMSDRNGAFSFAVPAPGMYLVEVVNCDDDSVRAVSDALVVGTSPLVVAIVAPATLAASVFSSTAFLVLSAAAAAGITAAAITRGQGGNPGGGFEPGLPGQGVLSPER